MKTLVDEPQRANSYTINWDGTNENDQSLSSGVYICKLDLGHRSDRKKLVLLR